MQSVSGGAPTGRLPESSCVYGVHGLHGLAGGPKEEPTSTAGYARRTPRIPSADRQRISNRQHFSGKRYWRQFLPPTTVAEAVGIYRRAAGDTVRYSRSPGRREGVELAVSILIILGRRRTRYVLCAEQPASATATATATAIPTPTLLQRSRPFFKGAGSTDGY